MSNERRFGLVCWPISWIDCSFSMKTITAAAASRKRPFFIFSSLSVKYTRTTEQMSICLSIYPCLLLFRLHARFSLSTLPFLLIAYQSSIPGREKEREHDEKEIKDTAWKKICEAWHDRSIHQLMGRRVSATRQSIHLMRPFSLSLFSPVRCHAVCLNTHAESENEQKNGNDSFRVLLLLCLSLSFSISLALCRFTHGWQNEFDQPDALHHINSATSALIWLEQGWWWSARCWLILFLILQLSLSLPFAPNRFSCCARRCFSRIATNKTTIDWSAQITSHHFGISLFSRSDDASWRLPNHRFLSLRSQPIIVVRLLVIILWLWLTTESITHRSSCISSSIMFDEILQRQNIQTQESHFTSPLVTCFNEWRSTAHGHLRRSVESRRADRKTTLSSVRRHGRWLSITRVDVCGCINNTSTTNTPPTHRVSWFVSTFATALRWSQLMTREMHVCGSECRQT